MIHCSIPPIVTNCDSSMPFGDEIAYCCALRARRKEAKSSNLRYSESMAGGAAGSCWPLAICPNVPPQTEERKVTSKDASDHTWLLREDRDFLIPQNMLRNGREEDIGSDLSATFSRPVEACPETPVCPRSLSSDTLAPLLIA